MKTAHIVLLVAAAGAAYMVYRGSAPVVANPGSVLAPPVGAPVATAPVQSATGSESSYTPSTSTTVANSASAAVDSLSASLQSIFGGWVTGPAAGVGQYST